MQTHFANSLVQDWDIVIMKLLKKTLEEHSIGMRLRSTLLLAPAASMDQLKRWQLDNAYLYSIGQLPLLVSVEQ